MIKRILKVSLIAILMFTVSCKVEAQQQTTKEALKNSTPQQCAKFITDTLKAVLNLSDEQYAPVYNINLDNAKKNTAILQSNAGKLSKFKQLKANQQAKDAALQKVLTAEQFGVYKQREEELTDKMKQRAGSMQH